MAWTTPRTWVNGEIASASLLNTHLRDNLNAIDDLLDLATGSFTDGGILLGNGSGVIQAMSALDKGSLVVGDGTTDPSPLTVGADNSFLIADSGTSLGITWYTTPVFTNIGDIQKFS